MFVHGWPDSVVLVLARRRYSRQCCASSRSISAVSVSQIIRTRARPFPASAADLVALFDAPTSTAPFSSVIQMAASSAAPRLKFQSASWHSR